MSSGPPGAPAPDLTAGGLVTVEDRVVPGPAGEPDVTVLILRPATASGPVAGIYHIHSGGMVTGDRRSQVDALLPYVAEGRAVVVSVEYRLAPEHPDPAPVEDCYAGLVWTAENAAELDIDPHRLMILGASSGGGLAAGTALLARDRDFPALSHQVLICPMLDDRLQTHSSRMLDGDGTWDRNDNLFGWTALLGDRRGGPDVSPYAAPARATDLGGLPRTYIDCGSAESFRDEAIDYATRLSQAGVLVDLHLWGGGCHGYEVLARHSAIARASLATRDEFIRRVLES
ncbi:alpha/beta hydrolase [Actinoplanes sp. NEAU-H7]|uniref:Alpha/beta hydrolase n=2 Tax=Actinoplanes flavus TaxID=2820290 RepID=A0ABS3US21_9ACTN|nr:alpha/beta hydrolase [Actinoplanes flavus]